VWVRNFVSLTETKKHRLSVSENRVLRSVFETEMGSNRRLQKIA